MYSAGTVNTNEDTTHQLRWKHDNTSWPYIRKRIVGIPIWKQKIRKLRVESKELFWKNTRFFYRIINWYTKETTNIRTTGAITICLSMRHVYQVYIYRSVTQERFKKIRILNWIKMTKKVQWGHLVDIHWVLWSARLCSRVACFRMTIIFRFLFFIGVWKQAGDFKVIVFLLWWG